MTNKRVCVIGAGIAGLTTAYILLKKFKNLDVTVLSKDFNEKTTSWVAAGFHADVDITNEKLRGWAMSTRRLLKEILDSGNGPTCGVYTAHGYKIVFDENEDCSQLLTEDIVKELSKDELTKTFPAFDFTKMKNAYLCNAIFCNPMVFMPYLYNQIQKMGCKFIKKKLTNLNEVSDFDCIVNCLGFGAKDFFNDNNMYAARGQVIQMEAPFAHFWYQIGFGTYGFPSPDGQFKLGGSFDLNNTDLEPDLNIKKQILENAIKLIPGLKQAKIKEDLVGLRPVRKGGPRIEMEEFDVDGKLLKVVHNYGYGATGYSFFWGCSNEAVNLVTQELFSQLSKY